MANNLEYREIWEEGIKPRIASELGVPNPLKKDLSLYGTINSMIQNLITNNIPPPVILNNKEKETIEESENDDNEHPTQIIPLGPGLSNSSLNTLLVGCYASSYSRFYGGIQAGCGTYNNKQLSIVSGSSSDGVGIITPNYITIDNIGGHCMYYEWEDINAIKPSLSVKASVLIETPNGDIPSNIIEEWSYGVPVTLKKNKIAVALMGDNILGITCPPIGIVSNAQELEWHGKYEKTMFGAVKTRISYTTAIIDYLHSEGMREDGVNIYNDIIKNLEYNDCPNALEYLTSSQLKRIPVIPTLMLMSPISIPVIAPSYNSSLAYIPRRLRSEWVPVCYSGVVRVRKEYIHIIPNAKQLIDNGDTITVHI